RARKADALEAFTVGYKGMSLDEIKWDADSHKARMAQPYVNLTIEPGRYERDPLDPSQPKVLNGPREASLGTDDFFDLYFESDNGALAATHSESRARDRRDSPTNTTGRRILEQFKGDTRIDPDLDDMKVDHKIDVRSDAASAAEVASLIPDAMNGV